MKKSLPIIGLIVVVLIAIVYFATRKSPQNLENGEQASIESGSASSSDQASGVDAVNEKSLSKGSSSSESNGAVVASMPKGSASGSAEANGVASGAAANGGQTAMVNPGLGNAGSSAVVPNASGNAANPAVAVEPKPVGPQCVRIAFHHQEKDLKVKRHELAFPDKVESKKDICVTVNGEGVNFNLEKGSKIVLDHRIRDKSTEIVATFCSSGACKLSCPKPKKDFFDEISGESSDEVIRGFAGEQSAEEKKLQKELTSLQALLKEPNEKKRVAQWTESNRVGGPCGEVVTHSKL
jgi:hypothetical protein